MTAVETNPETNTQANLGAIYSGEHCLRDLAPLLRDARGGEHDQALRDLLKSTRGQAVGRVVCDCCGVVVTFFPYQFVLNAL